MAKTQMKPQTSTARRSEHRQLFTLEYATALCPHQTLAENLSRTFGLEPVDPAAIREAIEEHTVRSANALVDNLNEKAMQIHLQRVVASFVGSACGAGQFYGQKVSQARDITSRLANDDRDEDRGGPSGFEDKAARARLFAAEMGLQAFALLVAAEGAVSAYAHITGEDWKPYEAPQANQRIGISRQSCSRRDVRLRGLTAWLGTFGSPAFLLARRGPRTPRGGRRNSRHNSSTALSIVMPAKVASVQPLLPALRSSAAAEHGIAGDQARNGRRSGRRPRARRSSGPAPLAHLKG